MTSAVALVGGTGRSGPGLALRFAMAGVRVHIGSREASRGAEAAERVGAQLAELGRGGAGEVSGHTNADAVARAETVLVTVPYEGQAELLVELAGALDGRVVVSTVVPVRWDRALGPVALAVPEGSAAEQAAALVPGARVAAGFHSLSSSLLVKPEVRIGSDVVVTGDDADAKRVAMELAELIDGVRAVDGGALRYARFSEGLTVLLMSINRVNRAHTGVVITDLPGR